MKRRAGRCRKHKWCSLRRGHVGRCVRMAYMLKGLVEMLLS